jgi:hypothetical protein
MNESTAAAVRRTDPGLELEQFKKWEKRIELMARNFKLEQH